MNLFLLQQYQLIQKLYKNNDWLDIVINIDDFFDIINLYSFPNWLESEIVDVNFMRYYTNIILKQPYDKIPHPKGGILLSNYDCKVKYRETKEWIQSEINDSSDMVEDKKTGRKVPKMIERKVWLVDILIPNRLIINDYVYDIEEMQKKFNKENTTEPVDEEVIK